MRYLAYFIFGFSCLCHAEIPKGVYQKTVFQENFSASKLDLSKWTLYKSSSVIEEGVLVGIEEKDGGHAAVHGVKDLAPFSDVEVSLRLKFEGSKSTNLAFNHKGFKESHAGHICRVVLTPTKATLKDGVTGNFRNDIFELIQSKKLDDATKEYLKTKQKDYKVNIAEHTWVEVTIRIKNDVMELWLDNKLVGDFQSEGIAHQGKNSFTLVTSKEAVHYDDVVIKVP